MNGKESLSAPRSLTFYYLDLILKRTIKTWASNIRLQGIRPVRQWNYWLDHWAKKPQFNIDIYPHTPAPYNLSQQKKQGRHAVTTHRPITHYEALKIELIFYN